MKPFHIFFIPYWVLEVLEAQQTNPAIITNYLEIKKYLSQEDLIELLTFQGINLIHTTPDKMRGTGDHYKALLGYWLESCSAEFDNEIRNLNKIAEERIKSIEYVQTLMLKLEPTFHEVKPENFNPYQVLDLKGENIGLVIGRGYQKVTPKDFYSVIQAILRVLYMYEPTVRVVNRPIFRLYVELMMRNRVTG